MAMIRAVSQPSQPEKDLADALRDFETILSDQQKQELRSAGPPNPSTAIELATQIDKECTQKRRRCMGPRFMLFIDSLQKIYDATDTFVSSHPESAALVWGGLKVTILVRLVKSFRTHAKSDVQGCE